MKFEYLLFNAVCFFSVAISSYLFKKHLAHLDKKTVVFSIFIVAIPYILLDNLVTGYFWYFNPKFVLEINLIKIPIEEALFFFTVPFACLFLWINFKKYLALEKKKASVVRKILLIVLVVFLGVTIYEGIYYSATVLALGILAVVLDQILNVQLFKNTRWYYFLFGVAILTLVFNYYLTARPIVLYFDDVKSNLMVLTIPLEDFLFGLSLISMCVSVYEKLLTRKIYADAKHSSL